MIVSDVQRSKHTLPYVEHPGPMTPTEGKYDIIEPWEHCHISSMIDFC